jgi:hypothetical protein
VNVHGSGDCFCFSVECVGSGNLFWVLMNDLLSFFFFFGYLFGLGLFAALKERREKLIIEAGHVMLFNF